MSEFYGPPFGEEPEEHDQVMFTLNAQDDSDQDGGEEGSESHSSISSGEGGSRSHSSNSSDSEDIPDGPIPFDEEHPNMYVPWGMKKYPTEIIEAWTKVHNFALSGQSLGLNLYLNKLSTEVLDQPNHEGETLLYMASFRGCSLIVEQLLKAGASPSKGDSFFDRTPLMIAVQNCHLKCVEKLLEYADVNEKNEGGFSPLFSAAQYGQEMLRLIDCPHIEDNLKIRRPRNKIVLQMLLDKGADVNCTSSVGLTPLLLATVNDNATAVELLLERGADPLAAYCHHMVCDANETVNALEIAAGEGFTESLKVILHKCSSIKELLSKDSAMCLAVKNGHLSCIKCFINAGFDADLGVKLPPDELATYRESEEAVPLLASIDKVDLNLVEYLRANGASPLYHSVPIQAPLCHCPLYVAFLKSKEVLKLLLEHCAELECDGQCERRHTPEFPVDDLAVWKQPVSHVRVILQAGFTLDLEKAPRDKISEKGYLRTFEEVVKMWLIFFPDQLPRALHLADGLNLLEDAPQSLADLCRVAVRRSIGFPRLAKPSRSVQLLPVPQHLQDYIAHV